MTDCPDGVNWKDYVDTQLNNLREMSNSNKEAFNERLHKLNELRQIVEKIQSGSLPRAEHSVQCNSITTRVSELASAVNSLREAAAESKGKASMGQFYLAMFGTAVAIVTSIAGVIIALAR